MHSPLWGPCTSYGYGISGVSLRRFSASNHHLLMHNFRRTCFRTTAQLPSQTSFTLPRTRLLYAHPLSSRHTQCQFHTSCRQWSWFPRFGTQKNHEPQNEPSDLQEEAAKAAILEKAMKGRQPTDLLLRCEFSFFFFPADFCSPNTRSTDSVREQAPYWTPKVSDSRGRSKKCTVWSHDPFTFQGNVKTISGQFRRADLCSEHRLNVNAYSLTGAKPFLFSC